MADDIDIQQKGEERKAIREEEKLCATRDCPNPPVDGLFCKKCSEEWDTKDPEPEVLKEDGKVVECPRCGSTDVRTNRSLFRKGEVKQGYKCRGCGKEFVFNTGGKAYHETILENKDLTAKEIVEAVRVKHGITICENTVCNVLKKHGLIWKGKHNVLDTPEIKETVLLNKDKKPGEIQRILKEKHDLEIAPRTISRFLKKGGYKVKRKEGEEVKDAARILLDKSSSRKEKLIEDNLKADKEIGDGALEELVKEKEEESVKEGKDVLGYVKTPKLISPSFDKTDLSRIQDILKLVDEVESYKIQVFISKR